MPLYSYECFTCNKRFDDYAPMSECAKPAVCECGGSARRVITGCSVKSFPGSYQYNRIQGFPPGTDYTDRKEARGDGNWE